jgi:hypothetical protein
MEIIVGPKVWFLYLRYGIEVRNLMYKIILSLQFSPPLYLFLLCDR